MGCPRLSRRLGAVLVGGLKGSVLARVYPPGHPAGRDSAGGKDRDRWPLRARAALAAAPGRGRWVPGDGACPPRPHGRTVILAMFAITAHTHTRDREAYLREVERYGQALPRRPPTAARNDQAIAAREARLAARLRAVEHAYQTALDHDQALTATQARPGAPRRGSHPRLGNGTE